jgi:hypothetical protein
MCYQIRQLLYLAGSPHVLQPQIEQPLQPTQNFYHEVLFIHLRIDNWRNHGSQRYDPDGSTHGRHNFAALMISSPAVSNW